jgi:hypothetical protein
VTKERTDDLSLETLGATDVLAVRRLKRESRDWDREGAVVSLSIFGRLKTRVNVLTTWAKGEGRGVVRVDWLAMERPAMDSVRWIAKPDVAAFCDIGTVAGDEARRTESELNDMGPAR